MARTRAQAFEALREKFRRSQPTIRRTLFIDTPPCNHEWRLLDDHFKQCTRASCKILVCYAPTNITVSRLWALIKSRELPISRGYDNGICWGYTDILLNKQVQIRRDYLKPHDWHFRVYIDHMRGWYPTGTVHEHNWSHVVAAVEPLILRKASGLDIFRAAVRATYAPKHAASILKGYERRQAETEIEEIT